MGAPAPPALPPFVDIHMARAQGTYLGTLENVNHLDLVGWTNVARYTWAEIMGRAIKFRPATFYLGIADHLARVVERQGEPDHAEEEETKGSAEAPAGGKARDGAGGKTGADTPREQARQRAEIARRIQDDGAATPSEGGASRSPERGAVRLEPKAKASGDVGVASGDGAGAGSATGFDRPRRSAESARRRARGADDEPPP